MKVVKGFLYTNQHEWVRVEGEKAYIGVTDYAQHALGDIVFVELPEVDAEFSAEESAGAIESVKAASDIFMPISGKVIEVNDAVVDDPALVNADPYDNWMICIEITDSSELDNLLKAEEYEELCSKEA